MTTRACAARCRSDCAAAGEGRKQGLRRLLAAVGRAERQRLPRGASGGGDPGACRGIGRGFKHGCQRPAMRACELLVEGPHRGRTQTDRSFAVSDWSWRQRLASRPRLTVHCRPIGSVRRGRPRRQQCGRQPTLSYRQARTGNRLQHYWGRSFSIGTFAGTRWFPFTPSSPCAADCSPQNQIVPSFVLANEKLPPSQYASTPGRVIAFGVGW